MAKAIQCFPQCLGHGQSLSIAKDFLVAVTVAPSVRKGIVRRPIRSRYEIFNKVDGYGSRATAWLDVGQPNAGLGVSKYRISEVRYAVSTSTTVVRGTLPASDDAAAHDDDDECRAEHMFDENRGIGD
jgi:hypothetical protein